MLTSLLFAVAVGATRIESTLTYLPAGARPRLEKLLQNPAKPDKQALASDPKDIRSEQVIAYVRGKDVRVDVGDRVSIVRTEKLWIFIDPKKKRALRVTPEDPASCETTTWELATDIAPLWPGWIGFAPDLKRFDAIVDVMKHSYKGREEINPITDDTTADVSVPVQARTVGYRDIFHLLEVGLGELPPGRVEWVIVTDTTEPKSPQRRTLFWNYHNDKGQRWSMTTDEDTTIQKEPVSFAAPSGYKVDKVKESDLVAADTRWDIGKRKAPKPLNARTRLAKSWRDWLESMAAIRRH